jgi:class 3 adenylate cyclase
VKLVRSVILAVVLAWLPVIGLAQSDSDQHLKQMQDFGGRMEHPSSAPPIYRERTFLIMTGLFMAAIGFLVFRIIRRRWRQGHGPVEFVNEAVLVVDLVGSTHLATHYGESLAVRAGNILNERALALAEPYRPIFAKNTGDGCFMTFPSVAGACQTAILLLKDFRDRPPDLAPVPALDVRAGISYGEILVTSDGDRHAAAVNKAFRLEGLSPDGFARVEGEKELGEIPERNRIYIDEEAAQELQASGCAKIPLRFVGFARLNGFSGLHRVYEVLWAEAARSETFVCLQHYGEKE